MAAPSSLLIAKLIMPETEKVDNNVELSTEREDANVIDAAHAAHLKVCNLLLT